MSLIQRACLLALFIICLKLSEFVSRKVLKKNHLGFQPEILFANELWVLALEMLLGIIWCMHQH